MSSIANAPRVLLSKNCGGWVGVYRSCLYLNGDSCNSTLNDNDSQV